MKLAPMLLLAPDGEAASHGGETKVRGSTAADLDANLLAEITGQLSEGDPALDAVLRKSAGVTEPAGKAADPTEDEAKAKAAADAKAKQEADAKAKAEADAKAAASANPEPQWTAEQTAWFEKRNAATTPEEIAAAEAAAPAFSPEELAWLEANAAQTEAKPASTEPEFTAEQKTWLAEQAKTQTAELTQAKADAEAASKRVEELQAELTRKAAQPVNVATIHPLFLADSTTLDREEARLNQFEEWCIKNWDGAPAAEAKGDQPATPAYTAEQVRSAYSHNKRVRETVLPKARESIARHIAENTQAKTVYPTLFDPKHPDYATAQNILSALPGLKAVMPNVMLVIGDAIAGEKLRLAKARAAALPGKGARLPAKPVVPLARPGPSGGSGMRARAAKPTAPANLKKFVESGGTQDALTELVKAALPGLPTASPDET